MMKLRVLSEGDECIGIDECRAHLEAQAYGDTDIDTLDDTMILGWLKAAREWAEQFTGLAFIEREYEGALDEFPADVDYVEIPIGPVISVTSITTGRATSSESDDAEVGFVFDDFSAPARLYPETSWPTVTSAVNGVRVLFTAGYGVSTDAPVLPWTVRAGILLILGHLYATRETNTEKALSDVPMGAEAMLRQSRVRLGMA
jgi:uncharacterized phiE125 gp8 family phage protein